MGHSERSPLVPTKSGRSERSSMERKPRHVVTRSRACLTLREENFVSSSWLLDMRETLQELSHRDIAIEIQRISPVHGPVEFSFQCE
ncbi:hypothetical protein J6590_078718 [Homalodisca vitripennis]|nr:hypothetical protein J6590_078718 [Homalodisca vitripennis]